MRLIQTGNLGIIEFNYELCKDDNFSLHTDTLQHIGTHINIMYIPTRCSKFYKNINFLNYTIIGTQKDLKKLNESNKPIIKNVIKENKLIRNNCLFLIKN